VSAVGEEVILEDECRNISMILGRCLSEGNSEWVRPEPASAIAWRQHAQQLQKKTQIFYFALKHPRMPWYARLVAACSAGYLFSPIQLIPSFIPAIGFLDDLLVLFLGVKLLQKITPPDVLTECHQLAEAADVQRKDETRSSATIAAAIVVATVWLIAALAGGGLMAAYFSKYRR